MKAGRLRHRITLERETVTKNQFGEEVPEWAPYATRWAEVRPQGGKEFWAAQQVIDDLSHEVRLRYMPGIQAKDRLIYDGRVFDIVSPPVNVGERDRELVLMCRER